LTPQTAAMCSAEPQQYVQIFNVVQHTDSQAHKLTQLISTNCSNVRLAVAGYSRLWA